MGNFLWAVTASILVSAISLVGIISLIMREDLLKKILLLMVAFAAGALLGGAFFHLLPEALGKLMPNQAFLYTLGGFVLFFLLERVLHWHHCHDGVCDIKAVGYLNLTSDAIHNFIDGLVIAIGFNQSISLGIVTTLAIIFHEIPQELGDFAILIYSGFTKTKALLYNFLTALTALAGTIIGFLLIKNIESISIPLVSITAGGFIYIAGADLIPEMHRQGETRRDILDFIWLVIGILFMYVATFME